MRGALLRTYSVPEQRSAHEHRSQLLNILLVTTFCPGGASDISPGREQSERRLGFAVEFWLCPERAQER